MSDTIESLRAQLRAAEGQAKEYRSNWIAEEAKRILAEGERDKAERTSERRLAELTKYYEAHGKELARRTAAEEAKERAERALAESREANQAWMRQQDAFLTRATAAEGALREAREEVQRLTGILNTPELHDFAKALPLEAAHQRKRWGTDHDGGKTPCDHKPTCASRAPAPPEGHPAPEGECGRDYCVNDVCDASKADGVLCANDECDIALGIRKAPAPGAGAAEGGGVAMHECEECGTMCDCDGDDLSQPQPKGHVCINEECGRDPDESSFDEDWDSQSEQAKR